MRKQLLNQTLYGESIGSLQEHVRIISKISEDWDTQYSTTGCWYRGQGNFAWGLIPSLYRNDHLRAFEREMARDFKLRSAALINNSPSNQLELLFMMQHYGLPTRLLDWTESHLVALFFAVTHLSGEDAAIWVIDPWSLNRFSIGKRAVPTSENPVTASYQLPIEPPNNRDQVMFKNPIAIRPTHNTPRIIAQKGVFTIHGSETRGLDEFCTTTESLRLHKIKIHSNRKSHILKELYEAGITPFSLFPELNGLAMDISLRYSPEFLNRHKDDELHADHNTNTAGEIDGRPVHSEKWE